MHKWEDNIKKDLNLIRRYNVLSSMGA